MAKQLNVSLGFKADTSQAKAAIQELNASLQKLQMTPSTLFDDVNLRKASQAAMELQGHLQQCVNVDTGKLDLSRFAQSMKTSNQDLNYFYRTLTSVGPTGQQAFLALSKSIANADTATLKISAKVRELGTTLANTARWQLSSSMLHGFMGAVQSAFDYAQDLNESLNKIRIVTGASSAEMDKFAAKANKAAKALSTSTTAYTDAALIFYQQGLSDSEVEERTNVTIKMAHAAGESATEVSSYMTAIWNNFADGSKELEYYGDVMAQLGAKTAASSAEIAEGLEKFASIGETVGLSYEYATAALATVVDKTRASADTVGTAFKTIFARLQGLSLGETLEDGVDLNKYSKALKAVGIEVLGMNGELKQADQILDELGTRWEELGNAEKMALAQTVAGTRQYTQLMSLMNNYDDFKSNVSIAENAEGTLDNQADTYAESWEAAKERVGAAAEEIYNQLLNDDFFISLLNGFEKVLGGVSNVIDGLGGLKGILLMVGGIFMRNYAKEIPKVISTISSNFGVMSGKAEESARATQKLNQDLLELAKADLPLDSDADTTKTDFSSNKGMQAKVESISLANQMTTELAQKQKELSQEEIAQYQHRINIVTAIGEQLTKEGEAIDANAKQLEQKAQELAMEAQLADGVENTAANRRAAQDAAKASLGTLRSQLTQYTQITRAQKGLTKQTEQWTKELKEIKNGSKEAKNLSKTMLDYGKNLKAIAGEKAFTKLEDDLKNAKGNTKLMQKAWEEFEKAVNSPEAQATLEELEGQIESTREELNKLGISGKELDKLEREFEEGAISAEEFAAKMRALKNAADQPLQHTMKMGEAIGVFGAQVMQTATLINGVKGLFSIWNNDDLTTGEKIIQTMTSFGMLIPVITGLLSKDSRQKLLNAAATVTKAIADKTESTGLWAKMAAYFGAATGATTLQASILPLLAITLLLAAAIMAVIGVIWLVVSAFNAWKDSTPEAKLEAAKEESARLSEELQKAKDASDALRESIEGYDNAIDKINSLEKGTAEWRAAIEDANDAARKLIDEYGEELSGKYHFNAETGLIEFDKGALDDLQDMANKKVETVQAQKLMSDNAVLTARQNVDNAKAVKNENIDPGKVWGAAGAAAILAPALAPFAATLAANISIGDAIKDSAQTSALEKLQEAYYQTGGNMVEAMNSLGASDTALIESLGYTDTQLEELCQASKANTQAILENNKQIVNTNFSDNEDYSRSANKEFLNEVLAGDLANETDRLYEEKYKDMAGGMTDADIQKQYAELMGWDANLVENKNGNKAVYIDDEGNEVTISDEQVRKYLAQEEALKNVEGTIKETSGEISKLALQEKALANAADGSIESYEEYKKAMHAYGKELGFTQAEIDSYIAKQGNMTEAAKKATLANNIQRWGHGEGDSKKAAEALAGGLQDKAGVSVEEQMEIMVNVSASSESYDEFQRNFEQALNEAFLSSFQNSAGTVESVMASIEETGAFSAEDVGALKNDENFQEYLEETGKTMLEFTSANYSEKYAIIAGFYADLKAAEYEALETSKQNYQDDLAEYQAIIDYKRSLNEDGSETEQSKAIKEQWDNIDFSAYLDMDISEVESKMDEVQDAIDEIDGQKVKLDLEWESTDAIENSMKKIGSFAKTMENDAKKVGNSYQLTAAQAKEWMQVYPELFANAEVTTDGLISLNGDYVNDFIDGQEASSDAAIDANIAQLESRLSELEAEKAAYEADLELAKSNAMGKEALENASAEYLAETRDALTQYYIDLGLDEVAAQKAALDTMGLNETEYSTLVANASSRNAENQIKSAEQGASGQASALSKLWTKVKDWASAVGNLFKNVWGALTGKVEWSDVWGAFSGGDITSDTTVTGISAYDENGNFKEGSEAARTAALKEINAQSAANIEASIADIDGRIASIRSEIAYNQALKNQDLSDFGSTDPDDVDGSSGGNDKDIEDLIEIAERYHEITREIEMQERKLDSLGKKKERAFGKDKLKLMQEEQKELQKLYDKQEELLYAQSLFLASDKQAVKDAFSNAQFDADGNISNYSDLAQQAADALNAAKTTYNGSAQEDSDKEALEKAQEEYDKQMELLEQYEETLDAWWDQKAELEDVANQILDARLEELDYKVNLQIELSDDELSYLEYLLDRIEAKAFSAAEAIANLGLQTQSTMNKSGAYKSGIMEIFGNHGLTEDDMNKWLAGDEATRDKIGNMSFTEDEVQKLRDYTAGLMETNQAMIELRQSVHDKILSTFEEMNQKIDDNIAKLEHLQNMTESYGNIIDLVGKANFAGSSDAIKALNASKVAQAGNVANANIDKRDMMAANLDAARATYAQQYAILSEEERKMWEDSIAEMESQLNEAEEAAMSSIESWMEAINDQFVAEIEATMDRFSSAVAGKFKNLNELQEAFERKQSENDRYLESYEKIYEFSKLNRDLEKSIDNTSNIKAKKELASLQAEINELEESGAEISEYQMENLRKRYELKLAELALEEAQNAKSEVRMTRDNEGNWGYVYTADETQVAEAEQSYEDKLFELQQQNAEYINTLQENIIQMQIEMAEKMAEIANDESLSIEERQAKMDEVQAYYKGQMDYYASEMGIVLDNNKRLYDEDWTKYSEATDYKMSSDAEYIDDFAETGIAIMTGFQDMEGYQAAFNEASALMLDESNDAFDLWEQTMANGPLAAMDTDFDELANAIEEDLGRIQDESDATAQEIDQDSKDMQDDYEDLMQTIVDWENQYSQSIDNMIADSDLIIAKFQEVLALWAEVKAAAAEDPPVPDTGSGGGGSGGDGSGGGGDGSGGGGSGGGGSGDSGGGGKPSWDRVVAAYNKINGGAWGNGLQNRINRGKSDGFTEAEVRAGQQLINYTYPTNLNGMGKSRDEAKRLMGYDTGGYTGEWGDNSGKLALLHQKELVLNEDDTANFLSAIDMIRQISSMIDLNAMSSMKGLGAMLAAGGVGQTTGAIEQHIEINASFPDATNHSEIEEAFHNLLNTASQYANRKL